MDNQRHEALSKIRVQIDVLAGRWPIEYNQPAFQWDQGDATALALTSVRLLPEPDLMDQWMTLLLESMGVPAWASKTYLGTPKDEENPIQKLWEKSVATVPKTGFYEEADPCTTVVSGKDP